VLLSIAASLRGVSRDVLDDHAINALRRNRQWAAGAGLALFAATLWSEAERYRIETERLLDDARLLARTQPSEALMVLPNWAINGGRTMICCPRSATHCGIDPWRSGGTCCLKARKRWLASRRADTPQRPLSALRSRINCSARTSASERPTLRRLRALRVRA
jgi:hypothetical protein